MAYDYIKRQYGVDPVIGQRITMDGKPGVICRPQGDPQYLRVRFDGQKHISDVHPTWEVDYSPAPAPSNYTGPARDGIEAQRGLNDIFPGDPCPSFGWDRP